MSKTYELVCHDCKAAIWIGQSNLTGEYMYRTPEHIQALESFLFTHKNHHLEFGDDEKFDYLETAEDK